MSTPRRDTTSKATAAALAVSMVLWLAPVRATDVLGVMPGDEALTCEQAAQFAAQGTQMQSDARLQQLLKLAQQKHCDKK